LAIRAAYAWVLSRDFFFALNVEVATPIMKVMSIVPDIFFSVRTPFVIFRNVPTRSAAQAGVLPVPDRMLFLNL
jgi:hypothetical protein